MSDTIFSFSKKDLLGGKVYPPGWYRVRIADVSVGPSKNVEVPSTNYSFNGEIILDADTGDTTYAEYPLYWMFNSRAMRFAKGFLMALGVPEESMTEDARFDFKNCIGKEIDIYVENDTYDGRLVNRVNHKYRVPRSA